MRSRTERWDTRSSECVNFYVKSQWEKTKYSIYFREINFTNFLLELKNSDTVWKLREFSLTPFGQKFHWRNIGERVSAAQQFFRIFRQFLVVSLEKTLLSRTFCQNVWENEFPKFLHCVPSKLGIEKYFVKSSHTTKTFVKSSYLINLLEPKSLRIFLK